MHIFAVYTHNVTQYTSSVHLLTVYVQWLQKAKNALIIISFFYLPHPPNIESFGNFRFELTVTKIMLNFFKLYAHMSGRNIWINFEFPQVYKVMTS